jgi:hypothetical protein
VVSALEKFPRDDQHRILRWAQEKLGIDPHVPAAPANPPPFISPPPGTPPTTPPSVGATDIRTFMTRKKPASDNQLAAAIAYYYQFEAPPGSRKNGIKSEDLKEAARAMGQGGRFNKPAQTLVNAHQQGLLDRCDGINQPYEFHDKQWGGLFDSAEAAERELLRLRPGLEVTGDYE